MRLITEADRYHYRATYDEMRAIVARAEGGTEAQRFLAAQAIAVMGRDIETWAAMRLREAKPDA